MELIIISIALIIAFAIIYWAKNNLNKEKTISQKTGIKSLGNIPLNDNNMELLIESNPKANIKKYIKDIRTNILQETREQVISFISAYPEEGKSWVANNIAISLARMNKKVLIIDANLNRKSTKNKIFYVEEGKGLSDFIKDLQQDNKIENLNKVKVYIKQTQIPNLHLLQNGTTSEYGHELLKSNNTKELIKLLKEIFDYIIIDGTSYFGENSCLEIAEISDTSIIVIDNKTVNYNHLTSLKEKIMENKGRILGYILNKTDIKKGKYYSKNNTSNYGIYIETHKEENKQQSLEEIIASITQPLQEKPEEKFEDLNKELKEKILIEDFINDIEVNFNTKLENIEKSNNKNAETLLQKLAQTEEDFKEKINTQDTKTNENTEIFKDFSEQIINQIELLKNEVNSIKQKEEQNKQLEEIKWNNYDAKLAEMKDLLEKQNYDVELAEIAELIEKQNQDTKLAEITELIERQNHDAKLAEMMELLKKQNYDVKIAEIKELLEKLNYDEQIKEINEKLKNLEKKNVDLNKRNNIIDLGKLFKEKRKDNNVFSIDELITFEDLEKLSVQVINLGEDEDTENSLIL